MVTTLLDAPAAMVPLTIIGRAGLPAKSAELASPAFNWAVNVT